MSRDGLYAVWNHGWWHGDVQGWTVRILLQANPKYLHPCRQCRLEPWMAALPVNHNLRIKMKSFSEACERNKSVILSTIEPYLKSFTNVLEVGSGNGQHAIYFAQNMSWLNWQTSDCEENHADINEWIEGYNGNNVNRPVALNVVQDPWPQQYYDAVYSANTVHIMPWDAVEVFFSGVGKILERGGIFMLYGPFNYNGAFSCESNRKFEGWLKSVDSERGIRDFESINQLADQAKMTLLEDIEMPANNRILIWKKQ